MNKYNSKFTGEEIDDLLAKVKNGELMPTTPSGDPMHYAYEAAGAVWNDKTGFWELNGLTDISTDEMRYTYAQRYNALGAKYLSGWWASSSMATRTNICSAYWSQVADIDAVFANNGKIEIASLSESGDALPTSMSSTFGFCTNLRKIVTELNLQYYGGVNQWTFENCSSLEEVRLYMLHTSIDFRWSPKLSKESLLYMIENCASEVSFTITLHPDVYDETKDSWTTEIEEAIERASNDKGTTITLASA